MTGKTAPMPAEGPLARARAELANYAFGLRVSEHGRVVAFGDGILWLEGLPSVGMEEVVYLADGSRALVYQLTRTLVGAVVLHQTPALTAGTPVVATAPRLTMPVGDALLGRVIDPLGVPLDGQPPAETRNRRALEQPAPPIISRAPVNEPLYTGNKLIDAMVPIGKGQRQLVLGDLGTGKSTLALDTVLNQQGRNVQVVLIGQKRSEVVDTLDVLRDAGALAYTTVVVAEATALPGLKYLAPFAGATLAESWMAKGRDTLVVYDDLDTHARSYREMSLLLRRPPGREAYPGDIFYLHARLLERSTRRTPEAGGGSMTALALVGINQGEIAAYIPTNLISITDGQIYLDQALFSGGFLPAIDITRSVSRIGGKAQQRQIKDEAGRMKLDYLQFLELEVFTRFGTQLEAGMAQSIQRGRQLREALKQEQRAPVPPAFLLAWMVAFNEGLLDGVPPERVPAALASLGDLVRANEFAVEQPRDTLVQALKAWAEQFRQAEAVQAGAEAEADADAPAGAAPATEATEAAS